MMKLTSLKIPMANYAATLPAGVCIILIAILASGKTTSAIVKTIILTNEIKGMVMHTTIRGSCSIHLFDAGNPGIE